MIAKEIKQNVLNIFNMITIAFCTPDVSKDKDLLDNLKSKANGQLEIIPKICTPQNGKTICQAYNEVLKEAHNDTIIFCHNDIHIITQGYDTIVEQLFIKHSQYGIIGVVGSDTWTGGAWMGDGGQPLGTLVQCNKYKPLSQSHVPKIVLFSPNYRKNDVVPAVTVDGMFICCRRDRIKVDLDEQLQGFHFYDVMFSADNFDAGVRVGVTYKLDMMHYSDGCYSQAWYEAYGYSQMKYQNKRFHVDLPAKGGMAISQYYKDDASVELFRKNIDSAVNKKK